MTAWLDVCSDCRLCFSLMLVSTTCTNTATPLLLYISLLLTATYWLLLQLMLLIIHLCTCLCCYYYSGFFFYLNSNDYHETTTSAIFLAPLTVITRLLLPLPLTLEVSVLLLRLQLYYCFRCLFYHTSNNTTVPLVFAATIYYYTNDYCYHNCYSNFSRTS